MRPLLLAILSACSQVPDATDTTVARCTEQWPRPQNRIDEPHPPRVIQNVPPADERCRQSGQDGCDLESVISQRAAMCIADGVKKIRIKNPPPHPNFAEVIFPGPRGEQRLTWLVAWSAPDGGSRSHRVYLDARTGAFILQEDPVAGRPCTIAGRRRVARLVRGAGWV